MNKLVSSQGRNLAVAVLSGLPIGALLSLFAVDRTPLLYYFLQVNALVLHGWFWQLFTSMIVAPPTLLGVADVAFNTLAIVWVDGLLTFYSPRQYYAIFLAAGLFGNVMSALYGSVRTVSFGASGGIFGLIAGAVSFNYAVERRLNITLLGWFVFIFLFSSFSSPYVDWLAHLGGSLLGLAGGLILGLRGSENETH